MPALPPWLANSLKPVGLAFLIAIVSLPGRVTLPMARGETGTVQVSILFNYGKGTLEWHNGTTVSSSWNFYNVTVVATNGNLASVFFASFGSHFVYMINGVGCPSVFGCYSTWSFWVLNGPCWQLSSLGVDQVQVAQGKTVAWFFVPVNMFGVNAPSGPSCISATIDVKPGTTENSINIKSSGLIPVAILSTPGLNASDVDPSTVRFGRTGVEAAPAAPSSLEDVNGDGLLDLVLHFRVQDTKLQPGDTQAVLTGRTFSGTPFSGSDSVHVFFPGDMNGDGKVNIVDLVLAAKAYGSTNGTSMWNANADFDGDGIIDIADLSLVGLYFGRQS